MFFIGYHISIYFYFYKLECSFVSTGIGGKMPQIKFIHQPGYIYDLISLFILHYNKDLWLDYCKNKGNSQEDLIYIKSISDEFEIESDDLYLFFVEDEVKGSFFIKKYFFEYADKFEQGFDFNFLVSEILNKDKFAQNLLDFYFPDSGVVVNREDNGFYRSILDLLSISSYSDKTKNRILSFFIAPDKFLIPLIKELSDKNAMLTKFYQKNYKRIIDTQENFDFEQYKEKLKKIDENAHGCLMNENIYLSVCLILKNTVEGLKCGSNCLQIIGYDYLETLEGKLSKKSKFNIDMFGKIISDLNRIEVIKMLTSVPELSTSDIAKNLGISINAAYYHLDMMSQEDMLILRNEGRTVYYRLNRTYVSKAVEAVRNMFIKK
jgi:DNA-binding transcriptional ArsR family regulator